MSTGNVDVTWLTSTKRNIATFLPIELPLMQGMLGYRPILTTINRQYKFKQIKTLTELKRDTVTAFGLYWDSLQIITTNGIPNRTSADYQELFDMVAEESVDYMPRGLNELYSELEVQNQKYSNLVASEDLAIYIPMATYFYVSVNNTALAKRLEKGLTIALEDGSFKRIFDKHFGYAIEKAKKMSPRVITLYNPLLPKEMPPIKTE